MLNLDLSPGAAVTGNDVSGFFRAPRSGSVVWKIAGSQRFPHIENGINDSPTGFHHVRALIERLVAHNSVVEKHFVPSIRGGAEIITVIEVHLYSADFHLRARNFRAKTQRNTFVGRDVNDELICIQAVDWSITKQHEWRSLELHCHFGVARGQPFASPHVKGNAGPAPVI